MYSMKRTMWPVPRKCRAIVDDVAVVHAALDDHVDLDRRQPRFGRGVDGLEHAVDRESRRRSCARNVASSSESRLTVIRFSPAALQRARFLARQQRAVRRQRDVVRPSIARQHRHQPLEIAAQQRLAAGEPELLDALATKMPRQPRDLLERQQLVALRGTRNRGRRPPSACSTCSGSCSDR